MERCCNFRSWLNWAWGLPAEQNGSKAGPRRMIRQEAGKIKDDEEEWRCLSEELASLAGADGRLC